MRREAIRNVAVIAYKVKEEMIVEGKPTTLEAFAGDPYGRR